MRPAVAECNDALGHTEGRRISLEDLIKFFENNANILSYNQAYNKFIQAYNSIYQPAENAFDAYASRKDIYSQYVREYYGKGGWFVFHNSFSGETHTTSMVDIAAMYLRCKIIIYLVNDRENKKIYETTSGFNVVEVNWNGHNHFVQRQAHLTQCKSM